MATTQKRPVARAVKFYPEHGSAEGFVTFSPIRCSYCDRQSHDGRVWFSYDWTVVLCSDCANQGEK